METQKIAIFPLSGNTICFPHLGASLPYFPSDIALFLYFPASLSTTPTELIGY